MIRRQGGSGMEEGGRHKYFSFFPVSTELGREPLLTVKLHQSPGIGAST